MVIMAMLLALSVIFTAFIRIPGIFPAASFLEYHVGDIPILMGSFLFGPLAGIVLAFMQAAQHSLVLGGADGFVGWLMNFLAGGTLAFVVGIVFQKGKNRRWIGGMTVILGALCRTTVMVGWNLIVTPWYYGWPSSEVVKLLLSGIISFNLLRSVLNTAVSLTIYRAMNKNTRISAYVSIEKGKQK